MTHHFLLTVIFVMAAIGNLGCNSNSKGNAGSTAPTNSSSGSPNPSSSSQKGNDDHGNSAGFASTLNLGITSNGSIELAGDEDHFVFTATGNQSGKSYLVEVFSNEVVNLEVNGVPNSGKAPAITIFPNNAGPIGVVVSGNNQATYHIKVTLITKVTTASKLVMVRAPVYANQLGVNATRVIDTKPDQYFDGFVITSAAAHNEDILISRAKVYTTNGLKLLQSYTYLSASNSGHHSVPIAAPAGATSDWWLTPSTGVSNLIELPTRGDSANLQLITDGTGLDGQNVQVTLTNLEAYTATGGVELVPTLLGTINLQFREFNRITIMPWAPAQSTTPVRSVDTQIADYCVFNSSTAHVNSITSVTVNVPTPPTGITNYRLRHGGQLIPVSSISGSSNFQQLRFDLGSLAIQASPNTPTGGPQAAIFQIVADTTACNAGAVVKVVSQFASADSASGAKDTGIHSILDPNTGQAAEFVTTLQ